MNFRGLQARYRRLYQDNATWKLLRGENVPIILAFLQDLFAEENEVPFGRARIALESHIEQCRELAIWETQTPAAVYLNQWIRSGWLREMDDKLSKTDASEVALRFCQNLDHRETGTTASHLRIVQEAVRDLAVAISEDADERIRLLENKKAEIQREIDALNGGLVSLLTDVEQRERIREIYQLAAALTGDFRRMEDDIRLLDQALRVQMIEQGSKRGEVLLSIMEKEALLSETDAGSAFEGFFSLLCDENRTQEFRSQLRSILDKPVAEQLKPQQRQFLNQLIRELTNESDRVFQIRRRTEEGLRAYIESGAALENQAVDRLLGRLERGAIALRDGDVKSNTPTNLSLPVGACKITSPETMRLRMPEEKLDTSGIELQENATSPSSTMLDALDTVRIKEVALRMKEVVKEPTTVGAVIDQLSVNSGLEELVAYLRVARAAGATSLAQKEIVEVTDKNGVKLQATIPTYLLSPDLFPQDINDLV